MGKIDQVQRASWREYAADLTQGALAFVPRKVVKHKAREYAIE